MVAWDRSRATLIPVAERGLSKAVGSVCGISSLLFSWCPCVSPCRGLARSAELLAHPCCGLGPRVIFRNANETPSEIGHSGLGDLYFLEAEARAFKCSPLELPVRHTEQLQPSRNRPCSRVLQSPTVLPYTNCFSSHHRKHVPFHCSFAPAPFLLYCLPRACHPR